MKTTSRKKLSFTQMTDDIEQGYSRLDDARAVAIAGLLRIREAKARTLQRQLETARKSGDKDSVLYYTALAADGSELISSLKREATLSKTPIPSRKENAAVVHGYVWRAKEQQLAPVAKARVAVFQQPGEELGKKLAETKTNSHGYFKMAVPIKATREKSAKTGTEEESVRSGSIAVLESSGKGASVSKRIPLTAESLLFRELVLTEDRPQVRRSAKKTKG